MARGGWIPRAAENFHKLPCAQERLICFQAGGFRAGAEFASPAASPESAASTGKARLQCCD
jgi:hypothetical protein